CPLHHGGRSLRQLVRVGEQASPGRATCPPTRSPKLGERRRKLNPFPLIGRSPKLHEQDVAKRPVSVLSPPSAVTKKLPVMSGRAPPPAPPSRRHTRTR